MGATALMRPVPALCRPLGLEAERAQPRIRQGIIRHYPVAGEVPGKPMYPGVPGVLGDPGNGTFLVLVTFSLSGPGPYSWPPESQEEPDPEKHAFYTLFQPVSDTFFSDPLPLAPLFVKSWKKPSQKGYQLYRLLRLLLETVKTAPRVTFGDGKWPILWHI